MYYTLGQAAKATGKSKSTLTNAIKKGRISASKGENGSYRIDPAELHRVYDKLSDEQSKLDVIAPQDSTLELREKLAASEARETMLRELVEELRGERDYLRQMQLTDQSKPSFWDRLFKR